VGGIVDISPHRTSDIIPENKTDRMQDAKRFRGLLAGVSNACLGEYKFEAYFILDE